MNLTSCDNCGAVFDKDRINFPGDREWNFEDDIKNFFIYDDGDYIPYIKCPVCEEGKVL